MRTEITKKLETLGFSGDDLNQAVFEILTIFHPIYAKAFAFDLLVTGNKVLLSDAAQAMDIASSMPTGKIEQEIF